jgi:twitching motility protein PilT
LWNLIRDNKLFQLPSLQQRGRNFGMIRLDDSLNELLEKGLITLEVAQHNAFDRRAVGKKEPAPVEAPAPESKKKGFFS